MQGIGRYLVLGGGILVAVGLLFIVAERFGFLPGRLPGDISFRSSSGRFTFYFPIVTSLVLSIILSLVLWLLSRR
jgi:hypothetical protein